MIETRPPALPLAEALALNILAADPGDLLHLLLTHLIAADKTIRMHPLTRLLRRRPRHRHPPLQVFILIAFQGSRDNHQAKAKASPVHLPAMATISNECRRQAVHRTDHPALTRTTRGGHRGSTRTHQPPTWRRLPDHLSVGAVQGDSWWISTLRCSNRKTRTGLRSAAAEAVDPA